ncbi:MAG: GNAT family N-acetyltransferase [Hyphomicrobiales bacterium]|nr:MAG: GNAT family N-acetyltransferase [Hyphomicrobiales bacterium]
MQFIAPTIDQIPQLQQLMRTTFTETFGHLYPPADLASYLDSAYGSARLATELADPRNYWQLVLDESGAAIAYLECVPAHLPHADCRPEHGEIERLYVLQSQQGRGLGRRLMELALNHLSDRYPGAPQWLGVWSENRKAQGLYRAYGFDKVGEYTFPVGETEDHEFIFCRKP